MPSGSARFEREVRIRFSHCDPAGIVFFPQYFVMFNNFVEDWVTQELGVSYAGLLGPRRVGMPTVSLQADFIAVSRMGEDVTFALAVDDVGTRAMSLALACRCGSEERVRARQVIVTTSLDTHEAIAIPSDLRTAIERFRHQGSAARRKSGGGP